MEQMEQTNAGATGALIAQRRRCLAALLALLLAAGLGLWRSGLLSLRDRCPSPAGDAVIRIYDGAPGSLSAGKALSLQLWEKGDWRPSVRVEYPGGEYQGLWWAPDGEKYLLAFRQGGEPRLDLYLREQSVCRDLTACLAGFPADGMDLPVPPVERGRRGAAAPLPGGSGRAGGLLLVRCRERRSQRPLGAGLTAGKPGRADPKKGKEWKPDGGVWRRLRGRDGGGERWAGRKDPLPRKRVRVPEMGC